MSEKEISRKSSYEKLLDDLYNDKIRNEVSGVLNTMIRPDSNSIDGIRSKPDSRIKFSISKLDNGNEKKIDKMEE
jgi:hypothetical protein